MDELDVRFANHTGGPTSRRTSPSPLAASAQIAAALLAVLDIGEEVLYPRPGWFAYCAVTRGAAATPVPVDLTWAQA